MASDTRQKILDTAKRLFNDRGYNAVSTGDIAEELGISKGNLTYHFQKKEHMVEALLDHPQEGSFKAPKTLDELHCFLLNMQRVVRENAFYFWHHAQIAQLSPNIRAKQSQVYQRNIAALQEAFEDFKQSGIMRQELLLGEYGRVIDTVLLSSIYWMPFCDIKRGEGAKDQYPIHAWTMIYPLLTQEGREKLNTIIEL